MSDTYAKWRALSGLNLRDFPRLEYDEKMTPLSGYKIFSSLSDEQKRSLFDNFQYFNAETFIYFEQCLLLAVKRTLPQVTDLQEKEKIKRFQKEELLHSKLFRQFLWSQKENWPQTSLV